MTSPGEHGTPAGWMRHRRAKEPVCDPCRLAHNTDMRERRAAAKAELEQLRALRTAIQSVQPTRSPS